jgi:hypothetical protein
MGTITVSLDKVKTAKFEAIRKAFYPALSFDDAFKRFVNDNIARFDKEE